MAHTYKTYIYTDDGGATNFAVRIRDDYATLGGFTATSPTGTKVTPIHARRFMPRHVRYISNTGQRARVFYASNGNSSYKDLTTTVSIAGVTYFPESRGGEYIRVSSGVS